MLFAHLTKAPHGTVGTLLQPSNPVDTTALLRARTLLSFLEQEDALHAEICGDWVVFSAYPGTGTAHAWAGAAAHDDYSANVPYMAHTEIGDQPGLALVRNDFETLTLFRKVYLRSSRDFLRARTGLVKNLRARFIPSASGVLA